MASSNLLASARMVTKGTSAHILAIFHIGGQWLVWGKLPRKLPRGKTRGTSMAELDHVLLNLDIIFPGPEFQP